MTPRHTTRPNPTRTAQPTRSNLRGGSPLPPRELQVSSRRLTALQFQKGRHERLCNCAPKTAASKTPRLLNTLPLLHEGRLTLCSSLAKLVRNPLVSVENRPPTSTARTTSRMGAHQRTPGTSLFGFPRNCQDPSLSAAPEALTMVVSTTSCAPPCKGRPSTTTSNRRASPRSTSRHPTRERVGSHYTRQLRGKFVPPHSPKHVLVFKTPTRAHARWWPPNSRRQTGACGAPWANNRPNWTNMPLVSRKQHFATPTRQNHGHCCSLSDLHAGSNTRVM